MGGTLCSFFSSNLTISNNFKCMLSCFVLLLLLDSWTLKQDNRGEWQKVRIFLPFFCSSLYHGSHLITLVLDVAVVSLTRWNIMFSRINCFGLFLLSSLAMIFLFCWIFRFSYWNVSIELDLCQTSRRSLKLAKTVG